MDHEILDKHGIIYSIKILNEVGCSIEVILHFPKSQKMKEKLAKQIATIHAQAILTSVAQQDCSFAQKIALIEAVQKLVREDMKKEIGAQ